MKTNVHTNLNVNAPPFSPLPIDNQPSGVASALAVAMSRLKFWSIPHQIVKQTTPLLEEWYSNTTLENTLTKWEMNPSPPSTPSSVLPLQVLTYNVQGWGTRALEVIDLIFKVDSPICVLTEVGELWNSIKIPQFNTFHQGGTNHSGGVMVTVGKHLRATRIETNIENTVIVDVYGLSEQIRIIGIYWPQCQRRTLNDLRPFLIKGTIITGDFNAVSEDWASQTTDKRGKGLKEWIEENEFIYIPSTAHSSKRADRHIDLTFTNLNTGQSETVFYGTSDHWPVVLTMDSIGFDTHSLFPLTNWTAFQVILALLEDFWTNELRSQDHEQWYSSYIRFLAALKCRLTCWKDAKKFRPSLPPHIVDRLREVRKIRNLYYRNRSKTGTGSEDLRNLLRTMSSDARKEINKYRTES
jgi:Endonuclease-reverse transcriptase